MRYLYDDNPAKTIFAIIGVILAFMCYIFLCIASKGGVSHILENQKHLYMIIKIQDKECLNIAKEPEYYLLFEGDSNIPESGRVKICKEQYEKTEIGDYGLIKATLVLDDKKREILDLRYIGINSIINNIPKTYEVQENYFNIVVSDKTEYTFKTDKGYRSVYMINFTIDDPTINIADIFGKESSNDGKHSDVLVDSTIYNELHEGDKLPMVQRFYKYQKGDFISYVPYYSLAKQN